MYVTDVLDTSYHLWVDVRVRFRDCDPMGHVNNAVYLTYLEMARTVYWKAIFHVDNFKNVNFILARAEVDYRSPAVVNDQLRVYIRAGELRRSSFDFHYIIWNLSRHVTAVTARTVQVIYDYTLRKPTPITPAMRERIHEFEKTGIIPESPVDNVTQG